MKTKLSFREYVSVASMLFGMFFGAGNLIFPVALGQHAGSNVWLAFVGLFITGVGMPLLGVAALGISRSTGLFDLSSKAGRPYGMFFTCLLYLTIGSFFAIPRCATTSFTVGLEQILPQNDWDLALSAPVLYPVLCRCPLFLPSSREDPHLDRQSPQPRLPALPGHPGHRGSAPSRRCHRSSGTVGRVRLPALLHRLPGRL